MNQTMHEKESALFSGYDATVGKISASLGFILIEFERRHLFDSQIFT